MAVSVSSSSSILVLPLLLFLSTVASACDRCVHHSRASFYTSSLTLAAGSCGYGRAAASFNGGMLAAAGPALYRAGVGCGACFQVRCKDTELCGAAGARVVVTDRTRTKSNGTDHVLSSPAFAAMARPGMAARLARLGAVDVEYKSAAHVQGAVRVQGQEPVGAGGTEEPRARRAGLHVPLPGRPDRHRLRRRRGGWVVELEVHDTGPRPGVEHDAGAAGSAAAQDRGDRRVRREVGVGRQEGLASPVARRRGVRHGRSDHRHRARGLLPLRHAGVEVTDESQEKEEEAPRQFRLGIKR
ncbi:unnamed protein product [Alopecurus aequalis]